ncbi:MAG: Hvo_1808 family surface protein [Haloarculaceae archaeon]
MTDSRRRLLGGVLAVLVVLAGCSSVPLVGHPDDPDDDRTGWENGYWYDDSLDVTPGDGYNATEREAIVARTMARVEQIRGLEFRKTVPVEVISREQYVANRSGGGGDTTHAAWNDQVWEGIFIVGESTGTGESFNSTLGASVQGFYSPGDGQIVLVSDSPTPTVDRATLAHELVHALQDQHFGLGPGGDTQDQQLATDGVIEGEANYIEAIYTRRCEERWDCIPEPQRGGGGGGGDINQGLFLTIYQPYATGPTFVDTFRERGGWDAVDRLHEQFPESTEQVIHPQAYPDEKPVNVSVPDRSNDAWERYDHDPVADTLGEASIYAMFVSNGVASPDGDRLSYRSAPSDGWGGDALVPYRSDDAPEGEGAYVWVTAWDTERDAEQFHGAYVELLERYGATNPRGNVYVVPDSRDFGDAFRVVREGDRVRVVNAPTVEELDGVHEPRD